jgi:predicted HAD superfamily Cof-like phosphohydrolase
MRFECDMLEEFNEAFEIPHSESPTLGEKELGELRIRLLEEEVQEYADAVRDGDLLEILDALGDIAYILAGSVLNHGLKHVIDDAFKEIHRSNMAKLVNGKVLKRADGKVAKPDDWTPPDLMQFLE